MKRSVKDWVIVVVLLLDEVAALALILLILWFFGIRLPLWAAIFLALLVGTFAFVIHRYAIPALRLKKVTGVDGMIGMEGEVIAPLKPFGIVKMKGEYWKAESVNGEIPAGAEVKTVGVKGLTLQVKRKT